MSPNSKRGGESSPPRFEFSTVRVHEASDGRKLLLPCGFLLLFVALFAQNCFAREANFVAFDGEHFDEDLVAQFQFVADITDALFGNFADVQEAVGAWENFHEGAE